MNTDPRGTMVQQGNIIRIDNALVEEVVCFTNFNGYILISYAVPQKNQTISIETIRLNLNQNTVVLNASGQRLCPCCIQKGLWINAIFSARMTRSIPPQSNAFLILIQRNPKAPSSTTTGRISFVDVRNSAIYTGNLNNINSQTKDMITEQTSIINRSGRPISLQNLSPGQLVTITHANFQTASIPPQTTAFEIRVLSA